MSKKKRRKKRRRIRDTHRQDISRHQSSGLTYQQMPSPFEGMSDAESVEHLRTVGEDANRRFVAASQELKNKLPTIDPLSLLSLFAYYGLASPAGEDPELAQDEPILQHHIELLQAFILQNQLNGFEFKPVVPPDFETFRKLIREISRSFVSRRFTALDVDMPKNQRRRLAVQESMRSDTQAIRNWGYPQQIMRITVDLFSPLDEDIENIVGVKITHLVKMLSNVGDLIEDRINSHHRLLLPMMQSKSIESVVDEYHRAFPDIKSEPSELLNFFEKYDPELDQVKLMLISHSDLRLDDIFTLTLDDFVQTYPIEIEADTLRTIIDGWSLSFGELADANSEYFFMDNPVWNQPMIQLGENLYFWPIPSMFLSFCIELMEGIIRPYPDLFARYENRRGKFLEDQVEYLFHSAMPSAKIFRGSQWYDPVTDKDFENDLLILIDTHLIVVEAKSGKVSAPARRGAEGRLQRTINELVIEPSLQANRFANYLQENPGIHQFSTRSGSINKIDTSEIREVVRLNITLEPIGMLQSRLPDLQDAGFIPKEFDFVPTLLLTDLEMVFDVLEGTCEKLHYLRRRAQIEKNSVYFGDEPDLLAFYLDTGFNLGNAEFDGTVFFLYLLSKTLDPYFMREWHKQDVPKPRRNLTKWWHDLLSYIEERKSPRWTEIGFILLNMTDEDQVEFESGFKAVQKIVKKHWRRSGHKNSFILYSGSEQKRDVLVGLAYKKITTEQRNDLMLEVGVHAMEQAEAGQALIIGVDIDKLHYPYNVIACTYARESDPSQHGAT